MAELIHTEGVVLRVVPFQDHNLILTVLTEALGKTSLFVKNARRPNSRYGPEIDLLSHSEFIILNSNNLKPLREANIKTYYHDLKANYEHLGRALSGARLVSHLVKENQRDTRALELYFDLLHVLNQKETALDLYELAFKLRLLDNFGVAPHLDNCVRCNESSRSWRFSVERGGLACEKCQRQSDVPLTSGFTQSLQALRQMEWKKLERLRLPSKENLLGNTLLDRFIAYHIQERAFQA